MPGYEYHWMEWIWDKLSQNSNLFTGEANFYGVTETLGTLIYVRGEQRHISFFLCLTHTQEQNGSESICWKSGCSKACSVVCFLDMFDQCDRVYCSFILLPGNTS